MTKLTEAEVELIGQYKREFFKRTGKKIEIKALTKWESYCKLDLEIDPEKLLSCILQAGDWNREETFHSSKKRGLVFRRKVIFYILHANGTSFKQIAKMTGRDHATIMDHIKIFEGELEMDRLYRSMLKEVIEFIKDALNLVTIN